MIREFAGELVWAAVVSSGRDGRVEPMTETLGPATWYVPSSQWEDYEGAPGLATGSDRGPAIARNNALDAAFGQDLPCLLADDDFRRGWVEERPATLEECGEALVERFALSDLMLAAARRGTNLAWGRGRAVSTRATIMGGLLLVRPNPRRFDERILASEDVDYGIQHVKTFGGVLRANDVLVDFDYHGAGGLADLRTADRTRADVARLLDKWGPEIVHVRDNGLRDRPSTRDREIPEGNGSVTRVIGVLAIETSEAPAGTPEAVRALVERYPGRDELHLMLFRREQDPLELLMNQRVDITDPEFRSALEEFGIVAVGER